MYARTVEDMGAAGHELSSESPDFPHVSDDAGAKSGAIGAQTGAIGAIVNQIRGLSEGDRMSLLRMLSNQVRNT